MRILIVTQYFWPENFRINDLALALTERGHEVEVLTGKPNYPQGKFFNGYTFLNNKKETWNNIRIHRALLIPRGGANGLRLMLNYFSFAFFASISALFINGKFDKILVYEPSPITVGIPAILAKYLKKAPIYFWVQDLWPQSVSAAGGLSNKLVLKILDKLTRWIYKHSDRILIQSEAFRSIILKQNVPDNKIIYYPNSVETFFKVTKPKQKYSNLMPTGFNIMFAGNIGESQDFDTIIEAANIVSKVTKNVNWVILGDGRKKEYAKSKVSELGLESRVLFLGSFPVSEMPYFFACADCLLVTLKRDYIFSLTIPSKIQSYLACGKVILASLDGEGGNVVNQAKAGKVVKAESPKDLANSVLELQSLPKAELEAIGINARLYFEQNFERELLVSRLINIFNNN